MSLFSTASRSILPMQRLVPLSPTLRYLCTAAVQNHFRTLRIPELFKHPPGALRDALLRAQRAAHPDRGGDADASAAANAAYAVLRDEVPRAQHLLELRGVNADDVPPALLMRVVEMREDVDAARGEKALRDMQRKVEVEFADQLAVVRGIDDGSSLEKVADAVVSLRYLRRVLDAVERRLEEINGAKDGRVY